MLWTPIRMFRSGSKLLEVIVKIVQINATCGVGSTGKIAVDISQLLSDNGIENYILYSCRSNDYKYGIQCSSENNIKINALKSKIVGNYGFNSKKATKSMINELERIKPDIVHLHNIHGHDCNIDMLFTYFKEKQIKLVWTFHDCWAFTAYCPHFTMVKCNKWMSNCSQCVQRREYSFFFDKSVKMFQKKKELFQGLDLTIITPSKWLADLVKQSFLTEYSVKVINNGIDLNVFKTYLSDFRKKYGIENKKIILGVSFGWNERKGLDVFVELSKRLSEDYKIVLVGTNEQTDKYLPNNILSIHRTNNQQELAEIYSTADVFVNPTREENYPTVNMEAIACGTPVVTFRTGGSPEMLDETCGSVVKCDDIESLEKEIIRICTDKPYSKENCIKKSKEFDKNKRYKEYLGLYKSLLAEDN